VLKIAEVGLCLLHPEENYINGLPVKAFEYMACYLPIIMSDFYKNNPIFKECALFAEHNNPEDIGNKIKYIFDNSEVRKKLGQNGRNLVEQKYNWEKEQVKLLQVYQGL
jgi:glycosyltransferase involved in cell wall biosynthesis